MHFHLPKPLHGWREFAGEVGIIVIGVLIALGAEQLVERLHHHSQVHGAIEKLRAEGAINDRVLDYDLQELQRSVAVVDRDLVALGGCRNPGSIRPLEPLPQDPILTPVDVAWQGARDNARTPLMPELQVDNYSKVDGIMTGYWTRTFDLRRDLDRASGAVESVRQGATDAGVCDAALLGLNELKQTELSLAQHAVLLRTANKSALKGVHMDIDPRSLRLKLQ